MSSEKFHQENVEFQQKLKKLEEESQDLLKYKDEILNYQKSITSLKNRVDELQIINQQREKDVQLLKEELVVSRTTTSFVPKLQADHKIAIDRISRLSKENGNLLTQLQELQEWYCIVKKIFSFCLCF